MNSIFFNVQKCDKNRKKSNLENPGTVFCTYHLMKTVYKTLYESDVTFSKTQNSGADRHVFAMFQSPKLAWKPKKKKFGKTIYSNA